LGISDHVIFTGPREDVERILTCFDLFVSASHWEGLSTVILEAMASCVPVVATDIPGNQEILEDGKSGWLVPPGNPGAMAETILWALRRPSLRRRYARQARDAVEAFSIETVSRQYERLYLRLQREADRGQSSKAW